MKNKPGVIDLCLVMSVMGACTLMEQYSTQFIKRLRFVPMCASGTITDILIHIDDRWE